MTGAPQGRRRPRRHGRANSDAERRALAKASGRRTGPPPRAPRPGFAVLSTDGGSRGNPGPAAIGYVLAAADGNVLAAHGEPTNPRLRELCTAVHEVAERIGTVVFTWVPAETNGRAHAHRGRGARSSTENMWQRIDRHGVATGALIAFVGGALFPRLAHLARWPTRLGPRGLVAYVAFNTAVGFGLRQFVSPRLRARGEHIAEIQAQLEQELGREPTAVELGERLELGRPPARRSDPGARG